MAAPKFNERSSVELSAPFKSSLDLIQDATLVHEHEELLSFPQLDIASPHMPPHHCLVDSDDEIDESDDEQDGYYVREFVSDDEGSEEDEGEEDDEEDDDKSKLELYDRPPSRLGRPLLNPYKSRNSKRNGPSVDRIKMENAFLKNQNNKLAQELEQCRVTIQALKNIVSQKDVSLQNSRSENQKSILQVRVLEALLLSKHSKDGSIILRSGGVGGIVDGSDLSSLFQEKETLKRKDVPRKPVPQGIDPATAPQSPQQQSQPSITQSPIVQTAESSDEDDLLPPPLPPKRHTRRWSIDFGTNNHLGNLGNLGNESSSFNLSVNVNNNNNNNNNNINNINSIDINSINNNDNITHITSSDDNTITSLDAPLTSSTLAPTNDLDLHRNVPRLIKRRTGDIIQSLASCRPSSTKNGYDRSPSSTPSSEREESSSDDANVSVINEKKPTKKKKSAQNLSRFRKMFLR